MLRTAIRPLQDALDGVADMGNQIRLQDQLGFDRPRESPAQMGIKALVTVREQAGLSVCQFFNGLIVDQKAQGAFGGFTLGAAYSEVHRRPFTGR